MPSTTLTVNSSALSSLLGDVLRAASADGELSMLAGLTLHTAVDAAEATVLAASATDRYCALHGHTAASGRLPHKLFLTRGQVSQIRSAMRPYTTRKRAAASQVEIELADGKVTFRKVSLADLAAVSVTFDAVEGSAPNVGELIEKSRARPKSDEAFTVDGSRLVMFAQIAGARREHLRMHSTGTVKPVICQIGTNLVGVLMPVRVGSDAETPLDVPVYLPPVLDEAVAA